MFTLVDTPGALKTWAGPMLPSVAMPLKAQASGVQVRLIASK